MITVDARCDFNSHCSGNKKVYRMVGHCVNCGLQDVLLLISAGHTAPTGYKPKCPACGCSGYSGGIHPDRLATEDEVPAA